MSKRQRGDKFQLSGKAFVPPNVGSTVFPQGPKLLLVLARGENVGGGVGTPEASYLGGTTSASEWYIIWALRQIFKSLPHGGEGITWEYQNSYLGGRHLPGGAVVDFIIFGELWNTGLRIQTFYYHFEAGSVKQATDFDQKIALEQGGLRVIDIYEQDFIHDHTGQASIRLVLEAMAGIERMNPRSGGITMGNV